VATVSIGDFSMDEEHDKYTVLGVDDDPGALAVLESVADSLGYVFLAADNPIDGLQLVADHGPDIVLLDVMMPGMNGFEVCRRIKESDDTRLIPVVLVTALDSRDARLRGIEAGCDDFVTKPLDRLEIKAKMRSLVKTRRLNENLEDAEAVLVSVARVIEARDETTGDHCDRLIRLARSFGQHLELTREQIKALSRAGVLHDIGKIGIPDSVLLKPGKLTEEEWDIMKLHPGIGAELLAPLRTMRLVVPIVRHHHERWDGAGYPDGLSGEGVPFLARVFQILDAYDALRSERPYKRAFTHEESINILRSESEDGKWDPDIVEHFTVFMTHHSKGDDKGAAE
jgi:putative two-component system response regulator